jgi:hypothetical protein
MGVFLFYYRIQQEDTLLVDSYEIKTTVVRTIRMNGRELSFLLLFLHAHTIGRLTYYGTVLPVRYTTVPVVAFTCGFCIRLRFGMPIRIQDWVRARSAMTSKQDLGVFIHRLWDSYS